MRKLLVLFLSVVLAACGGGSGGSSGGGSAGSAPPTVPFGAVAGATFDGLIINGTVKVYDFSTGGKGALLATGTSDATGHYNLALQLESRPILVEATGGYYFEEAGAGLQVRLSNSHSLVAVMNYTTGASVQVSASTFTHLAAGLAVFEIKNGTAVATAINDANGRVSGWLGYDILSTSPLAINDPSNASNALTPELRYGFNSGAISMWTHDHAPAGSTPHVSPFTSIDFAQLLYKDVSADGLLDGQGFNSLGALSQLSFGVTPLSVDVYRHQLAVSMLKMANYANNKTGLNGASILGYVQSYMGSTDAMFATVTPVSIAAPVVSVSSPALNAVLMKAVAVTATATTNGEISKMELLIDNNVTASLPNTAAPSFSLDTTTLTDGAHTVTVRATDTGGLTATSAAVPVLVVNTAPAVSFLAPAQNAVLGSVATVTVSPQSTVGIASVELLVDGVVASAATNLAMPAFSLDTRLYADGAHTLKARVTDKGGQVAVSSLPVVFANTAPGINVSAPAANALIRGIVTVSGATTSGSGVVLVELLVDNTVVSTAANVTTPTFSLDTTAFADGLHTLKMRATDVGGLSTTATVAGVIFNNIAPAVAVSAPATNAILRGSVSVTGSATSAAGIASVELLVDNNLVATNAAAASFTLNSALYLDGAHTITIRATDIGGLVSSASVPVIVNNVAPSLTLTAPAANAILQTTVSVTATASSGAGLKTVELLVDGQLTNTATNLTSPTFSINTAGYADGAHTIAVRATDIGGLVTTKSAPVVIANVPPVLTLTGPAPHAVMVGASPVTATASSGSGLSTVGLYVDGIFVAWAASPTAPNFSLATTAFGDGPHVVELRATDVGGNLTSSTVAVVFDNVAPVVTVTTPGNGVLVRKTISVAGSVSETAGLVSSELLVDGSVAATAANAAAPAFTLDTTLKTDGVHAVAIRTTDVGGHVVTQSRTITIDNTAPTSTGTLKITNVGGVYLLSGTASDGVSGPATALISAPIIETSPNGTYTTTIPANPGIVTTCSAGMCTYAASIAANGSWAIWVGQDPFFGTNGSVRISDAAGNCTDYATFANGGPTGTFTLTTLGACP